MTSDYGDWYVRLDPDVVGFSGRSQAEPPPEGIELEISVPAGGTPVTDALSSFLQGLEARPTSLFDTACTVVIGPSFLAAPYEGRIAMLAGTLEACDSSHRYRLVDELLTLYKASEPVALLVERLASFDTWVGLEHQRYATDAFVPALLTLMLATLMQPDLVSETQSIVEFMQVEMFTSVGLVRDRFLSSPPFRSRPRLLLDAATTVMSSVDDKVGLAQKASDVEEMLEILYAAIPGCVAARWLFAWCGSCALADVSASAAARWARSDEILARLRGAFAYQVEDLKGQEWDRLELDIEIVRHELGGEAATKFAAKQLQRHLLYPASFVNDLC